MFLAIIDTETTGVDPLLDQLVEFACVLYRVGHGPIACASTLLPVNANPDQEINGISPEMTRGIKNTQPTIACTIEQSD